MKNLIAQFVADDSGATAIEYALLASLIAVAIIGAVSGLAGKINTVFNNVGTAITK